MIELLKETGCCKELEELESIDILKVLLIITTSLFALSYLEISPKAYAMFSVVQLKAVTFVSSANKNNSVYLETLSESFRNFRKRSGPKIEP